MRLAIIIPTLDEEPVLHTALGHASGVADEIWVSDGGSRDRTVEVARSAGANVVCGEPGRGVQLNRGARSASAEILLFLHADTRLPADAGNIVREAITSGAVGGGFRVLFDSPRGSMRLGSRLANLRTRLTGCPLGDQAQFVRREVFESLGGYRDWPILEDLDFARRLKRAGRTVLIDQPVVTSARRFLDQGPLRTVAINWLIWALYFAGVSPYRLASLYRHIR